MKYRRAGWIFLALACTLVFAQESEPSEGEENQQQPAINEAITVVFTAEDFRFRSEDLSPKLVYSREFFLRYEPATVGDILKRFPGISGAADAGEFDLPQMRGIGPAYTQILINGKRVPGAANDRTLFVDRIPAEMVERVEVIRAPSGDMDAQGIGGTINIVLRDALPAERLEVLAANSFFDRDQTSRGRGSLSYGRSGGNLAFSLEGGYMQRHNPKVQKQDIVDAEGGLTFKDETNVLDSEESSFRVDGQLTLTPASRLSGQFWMLSTDGRKTEDSSFFRDGAFESGAFDHETQRQDNQGGHLNFQVNPANGGEFFVGLDYQHMNLDNRADFGSFEGADRELELFETDRTDDTELKIRLFYAWPLQGDHRLKLGLDLERKTRNAKRREFAIPEDEDEEDLEDDEGGKTRLLLRALRFGMAEELFEEIESGGVFRIREDRVDPYFVSDWTVNQRLQVQAGVRFESTDLELADAGLNQREGNFFPFFHYRYRWRPADVLRVSITRTTRRPDYEELQPFERRNQPRDGDVTVGNPNLNPEFAAGLDVGYEHRFAHQEGIFGINLFYRQIENRIETVQIDEDLFQPRNIDEGRLFGIEFDAGFPLVGLGMPNTSLFGNISIQDSRLTDPLTGQSRSFNLQSDYVVNLGVIHYLPGPRLSLGLNWLTQGRAREWLAGETAQIEYGDDMEILLEKKWKRGWVLRLSGKNLLNARRREVLREYDGFRTNGSLENTIFESEESGQSVALSIRATF